jgi:ribosome silencing factor RsfS/YbeB/iojap
MRPAPRPASLLRCRRTPAPLRASDSDDPSDDDDPAAELTPEELAFALSDAPPRAQEDGEDDADDDADWALTPAAFAAAAVGGPTGGDGDAGDARALAVELATVAAGTRAGDVTVLHVAPLIYWTSYMVLVTIFSRPQLQAVLAKAEDAAHTKFGRDLAGARNPGRSAWEVLDFGDVVLHAFTPDQREFYDLEGFYGAADEVELPAGVGGGDGRGPPGAAGWSVGV